MLALGLTTVILLAISMAVNLHLRSFDTRRKTLEESQLARAILRIIADDIRATVQDYDQDLSGIEQLLQQSLANAAQNAAGAAATGDQSVTAGEDDGADAGTDTADATEESTNTEELASAITVPARLGIYGNQYQLQIDVSRLPRYDEYQRMMTQDATTGIVDIPSDIKTITYYVANESTSQPTDSFAALSSDLSTSTDVHEVGHGLVRRQLDRAVAQYALENGLMSAAENAGEVIAPEVASIEFRYFDGVEWRIEWDTEFEQALPMAIEIVMYVQPPTGNTTTATDIPATNQTADEAPQLSYYRLVVPVATGEVPTATGTPDSDTTDSSTTTSSSTTTEGS